MHLKKIKAFGFKTFAEATGLDFSGGITAIVGPNGSGKSNLVDAFRWVLGETSSRSLRSGKLEDVIFAGNEKRKPLGMTEVSLTFDNTSGRLPIEFSEVEITRRAYRAGESEYFINRNQVRLRDIVELLMGTGLGPGSYAIVSQGQIDAILTSKPTERRALFEETAGINKFLARKHESMRRLEQTEANAIRINDLISELERRLPELDTQVRRAKRYRKVNARVRDLEILSYMRASASRRDERETLRGELEKQDEVRGAAAGKVAQLGANLAELRSRAYQQELQLEEIRGQAQSKRAELSRIEADYAAALARREALESQSMQTHEDAARVQAERESLAVTIENLEARLAPLATELDAGREGELHAQTALAQARAQLDAIFTHLREVEAHVAAGAAHRAERRVLGENLRAEAERLEGEAHAAREHVAQLELAAGASSQKYAGREAQLGSLETQAISARERTESTEQSLTRAQNELAAALAAHRDQTGEVMGAESRLHTIEELENSLEGHVPGTRAIVEAWQRGEVRGIEGIVSNVISTEERYARAMDVAFGARLSNIITTSSEDAEHAIEFLNRSEQGRATFLPLDTLGNRDAKSMTPEIERTPGVIGYAHTLLRTQPQYEGVVRFLVGNVLVVDTLQTGIHLVRERGLRDTIVTLSGEQIAGGGAITGGRFKRERSILSRRAQAQTLREALTGMRATLEQLEHAAGEAGRRVEGAVASRDAAREALARLELQSAELRTEMASLAGDLERMHGEVTRAHAHVDEVLVRAHDARVRERVLEAPEPESVHSDEERARLEAELARARRRDRTCRRSAARSESPRGRPARAGRCADRRARRLAWTPGHARSG